MSRVTSNILPCRRGDRATTSGDSTSRPGAEVPIYRAEAPVQPPPVTFTLVCCQTARVRVAGSTAAANRYLTRAYSRPSRVRWWNQRERAWWRRRQVIQWWMWPGGFGWSSAAARSRLVSGTVRGGPGTRPWSRTDDRHPGPSQTNQAEPAPPHRHWQAELTPEEREQHLTESPPTTALRW